MRFFVLPVSLSVRSLFGFSVTTIGSFCSSTATISGVDFSVRFTASDDPSSSIEESKD